MGIPRDHSSRWSTKSSRPESAKWKSSKTRTTGNDAARRSKNVRQAPNSSSASARDLDAQQGEQRLLQPASLLEIRHVLRERRRDACPGGRFVVRLDEAAAAAHHLAERPERDALAVRGGAALVPPDVVGQAVDVVQELAGDPGLADPGRAEDRHQPRPPLAGRRVVQVLQEPELVVAAHERGLEVVAAIAAAHPGDDPQGAPGRHGRGLARGAPGRPRLRTRRPGLPLAASPRRPGRCRERPPPGAGTPC